MTGQPPASKPRAIIVAGPTVSGKSALALMLARRVGGTVINADAMQCYADLRILTARPAPEDEAEAPHVLYGVLKATEPGSAAWWRSAALSAMALSVEAGRVPILCGGTGLYFAALVEGLAEIPSPGNAARLEARALLASDGPEALYARLVEADPETASRLRPTDSQRIARAWEVWRGTGRGLAAWHALPGLPPAPYTFRALVLDPPRPVLRDAIDERFGAMLRGGAVEEVKRLLVLGLDPALPLMRAHGVPELAAHLRGEITLTEAAARACRATNAYTKRQGTWFRHHDLGPRRTMTARVGAIEQFSEQEIGDMQNFLLSDVDAPHKGS